jgi:hypothetical protein
MKEKTVVTHSGLFHADELFAVAWLIIMMIMKNEMIFKVVRSRNPEDQEGATYVVDVGGQHNPGEGRFDHHQLREGDAGYGISSFGMVYGEFNGLGSSIPAEFVNAVDARDTRVNYDVYKDIEVVEGVTYDDFFNGITACNCLDINSPEQDDRFTLLVMLIVKYFDGQLSLKELWVEIHSLETAQKAETEKQIKKRLNAVTPAGVIEFNDGRDDIVIYAAIGGYIPNPVQHGLDALLAFDEGQQKFTLSVNTDKVKIDTMIVGEPTFIHANGFFAVFEFTEHGEATFTVADRCAGIKIVRPPDMGK